MWGKSTALHADKDQIQTGTRLSFTLSLETPPLDWISLGRYLLPCVSKDVTPEPYVGVIPEPCVSKVSYRSPIISKMSSLSPMSQRCHPWALYLQDVITESVVLNTSSLKPVSRKTSCLNPMSPRRHLRTLCFQDVICASKTSFMNPKPYPQMRHPWNLFLQDIHPEPHLSKTSTLNLMSPRRHPWTVACLQDLHPGPVSPRCLRPFTKKWHLLG